MQMLRATLFGFIFIIICSYGLASDGVMDYSESEREAYTEKSDLVFEGTIHEVVNIGGGKFKAQAQTNEEDLNWLVVFNVEKRLKGQYEHDTIGITVHSPALTFGHTKSSTINKHRLYLKSSPTDLRDYLVVGNELLRDDDQ